MRLARQLHAIADRAGLRHESEASVPFAPFVGRLPAAGSYTDRVKACLGSDPAELVSIEAHERPKDNLFFSPDALREGLEMYFRAEDRAAFELLAAMMTGRLRGVCDIRFDAEEESSDGRYTVSPRLWMGNLSAYLLGLWSYEVRT